MIILVYLSLGALSGLLAGLFGIGGGLIMVPVLVLAFTAQGFPAEVLTHMAIATSLGATIFTATSSIYSHHRQSGICWSLFLPLACGMLIGAFTGVHTALQLPGYQLQFLLGVFVLLMALHLMIEVRPKQVKSMFNHSPLALAGTLIGWISTIFGLGGGILTVPLLVWRSLPIKQAVGTAAACSFPIALTGAVTNVVVSWETPSLPSYSMGYIYLPAVLGVVITSTVAAHLGSRLAHHLPNHILQRIFIVFLILIGLHMLLNSWY
jgi:uncharacterized protein